LLGRNGCGKSTFLKCLAAKELPIPDHFDVFLLCHEAPPEDVSALDYVINRYTPYPLPLTPLLSFHLILLCHMPYAILYTLYSIPMLLSFNPLDYAICDQHTLIHYSAKKEVERLDAILYTLFLCYCLLTLLIMLLTPLSAKKEVERLDAAIEQILVTEGPECSLLMDLYERQDQV
jgi:hypothetical protein